MKKIGLRLMTMALALSMLASACSSTLETPATEPAVTAVPTFAPEAGPTPIDTESLTMKIGYGERSSWYEIYFTDPLNPEAESKSGGLDVPIVQAIDAAQQSIDLAIYNLSMESIGDALIRAHQRGVIVRMVMESENIDNKVTDAIKEAGIKIRNDRHGGKDTGLMHNKFLVIDRLEVWTGSLNFTASGVYADNNNLIRIYSDKLAENYTTEFNEMFVDGKFSYDARPDTPFPEFFMPGGFKITTIFSPDDGGTRVVTDAIRSAEESVYFMAYAFTSLEIMKAMEEKSREGIKITGVLDQMQMKNQSSQRIVQTMHQLGLDVRQNSRDGLMHHKVMIVDSRIVILGSFNFTFSAETRNDENLLAIEDPALAALFLEEFQRVYDQGVPLQAP
jgi:phosphatidylserine/phosphatidylglycerophosphate/cardiolipin synthase-like enzyme